MVSATVINYRRLSNLFKASFLPCRTAKFTYDIPVCHNLLCVSMDIDKIFVYVENHSDR